MWFSEYVYVVCGHPIPMTEQEDQRVCIKVCIKPEHSSVDTIPIVRRMELWATDWQLYHSTSTDAAHCAEFFGETSSHSDNSAPLQHRIGALQLLSFPKTKITFEREEISGHGWDSGKYHRAADGDWENCVRSQGSYFEGDWGVIVLCTMFLVSCIFFNKCLYFSYYMAGYLIHH